MTIQLVGLGYILRIVIKFYIQSLTYAVFR